MGNKVKFNLCNAHYAPITVGEAGESTYRTPVGLPGAVSISLDPNGEPESFMRMELSITLSITIWDMTGI